MKPILLFDIDGTLLRVKRTVLNEVIGYLFKEFGIKKEVLTGISFAGRTDKDIFTEILSSGAGKNGLFDEVKKRYIEQMNVMLVEDNLEIMEGAFESVEYALEQEIEVGLCTGNFREVAYRKVEAMGLKDIFRFGAFGCNHEERIHLPAEAHVEYQNLTGHSPASHQYVIIGDTPNDIKCAKYFGAKSVAVSTGRFNRESLQKHSPDIMLDHLGNPEWWFSKLSGK